VDVEHPHADRLIKLAARLESQWRKAVGSRFDLWFDMYEPTQKISFIKSVRDVSGLGLYESKIFSESLPNVFSGVVPLEKAAGLVNVFDGTHQRHRILPTTEVSPRGLNYKKCRLVWVPLRDSVTGAYITSVADTIAALGHLRRILASDTETAPLVTAIPQNVFEPMEGYAMTLVADLLYAEAISQRARWNARFFSDSVLSGYEAEPPFSGHIVVLG
jgi:hypothetical protein